jgi:periplasmic protein CpxP/Spy
MNRITKHVAITASFLLASVFPALTRAQDNTAPAAAQQEQAQGTEKRHDKGAFMANLNLTDDQKAQIKQIRESAHSQLDAVKNDSSLSADQKQAKTREIRRNSHEQMEKVLTPEQRKQFRENMRERREMKQQQAPKSN